MSENEKSDKLARTLRYEGALVAESALHEIAHTEGDEAVAKIAKNLTSNQISQITQEGDLVKPSLLHTAITPAQFCEAFKRLGLKWHHAGEEQPDMETIRFFQEETLQFFTSFLLLNEDTDKRKDLLLAITAEDSGIESLAFAFINEKDFAATLENPEGNTGDWREILGFMKFNIQDQWFDFTNTVKAAKEIGVRDFVSQVARDMYDIAISTGRVVTEETEDDADLFSPLT